MPESSVDSYIAAQPEQLMSRDQFYQANYDTYNTKSSDWNYSGILGADSMMNNYMNSKYDRSKSHYNDLAFRVGKFTGLGPAAQFESDYQAYVDNVNARNEFRASQSARAYDKAMDDTKIQRAMKDYEAAGLNPYLILNSGSIGGGSAPTSTKADYKHSSRKNESDTKGRDFALILLAIARVAAAFM